MWILYFLVAWITIMIPIGVCLLLIKGAAVILYGSRVVFALVIALIVNSMHPLFESGFLSYLAWAAIVGVGTYLLCCLMPRFNCAYYFLSSSIIPFFLTYFVIGSLLPAILGIFDINLEYTLWMDIVSKVVSLAAGVYAAYSQFEIIDVHGFFAKPVGREIDRTLASFLYGLGTAAIITAQMNNLYSFPDFVIYVIMGAVAVGYFVLDCIVIGSSTYGGYVRTGSSGTYAYDADYCDSSFDDGETKPSLATRLITGNIFGSSESEIDDMIDNQL